MMLEPPAVFHKFIQPHWLIAVFLVAPLLSLAGVNLAVMVSSRVSDPG